MKTWRRRTEDVLTAATFLEADFPKMAREFLEVNKPSQRPVYLGIPGVKIWFGTILGARV
ncbi:MAG: hypothetical protein JRJ12_08510 [Deltaproteobacteria bacterium]|nr:hypothetical protein [Deltaproteobacteria bacterium]MBW2071548.1 hypothetical protein [Deltaproteobacteria bacterium]